MNLLIRKFAAWLILSGSVLSASSRDVADAGIHLSDGQIFINGQAQSGRFSVSKSDFRFLYVYVPAEGLFVISNKQFTAAVQAGQFEGRNLDFVLDGVHFKLTSRSVILAGQQPAWVHHDAGFSLNVKSIMFGYGDSELTPYEWPNQIKSGK